MKAPGSSPGRLTNSADWVEGFGRLSLSLVSSMDRTGGFGPSDVSSTLTQGTKWNMSLGRGVDFKSRPMKPTMPIPF